MENQRCDLFRAVLEGVTLNLNIILESFRRSIPIDELLVVGGGAKGALWCQMMADVYNARIKVPVLLEEATSMGAAVTGGVGVGCSRALRSSTRCSSSTARWSPTPRPWPPTAR